MMCADLQELVVLSAMFPSWSWRQATARRVIVASEGSVIRLYWMPALLYLDEFRGQLFVQQLNAVGVSRSFGEG
ncbi:hypothetical protein C4K19_0931 [Pseudomonas chlororaphis subsp. aurantiaca]|nr:hypothetical protein C4K19_0931 [Pseudomonas chlororaphis subsp. aurantiaca]